MSDKRLNNQLTLAFPTEDRGEALRAVEGSVESLAANRPVERPGMGEQLREVCTGGQSLNPPNRRIRTRTYSGVTGKAGDRLPMSIFRPCAALKRMIKTFVSKAAGALARAAYALVREHGKGPRRR